MLSEEKFSKSTQEFSTKYENIHCLYTFGSPRVGNEVFVSNFNEYNIYSKRITHYYDMVLIIYQQSQQRMVFYMQEQQVLKMEYFTRTI